MKTSYRFYTLQFLLLFLLTLAVLPNAVGATMFSTRPCDDSFWTYSRTNFFDNLNKLVRTHASGPTLSETLGRSSSSDPLSQLCEEISNSESDFNMGDLKDAIVSLNLIITMTQEYYPEHIDLASMDLIIVEAKRLIGILEKKLEKTDLDGDGVIDELQDKF